MRRGWYWKMEKSDCKVFDCISSKSEEMEWKEYWEGWERKRKRRVEQKMREDRSEDEKSVVYNNIIICIVYNIII